MTNFQSYQKGQQILSTLLDNVHLIAEFVGGDTPYVVGAKTFEHNMMMSSISVQWGLIGDVNWDGFWNQLLN